VIDGWAHCGLGYCGWDVCSMAAFRSVASP
jgi:hypothetical protein